MGGVEGARGEGEAPSCVLYEATAERQRVAVYVTRTTSRTSARPCRLRPLCAPLRSTLCSLLCSPLCSPLCAPLCSPLCSPARWEGSMDGTGYRVQGSAWSLPSVDGG